MLVAKFTTRFGDTLRPCALRVCIYLAARLNFRIARSPFDDRTSSYRRVSTAFRRGEAVAVLRTSRPRPRGFLCATARHDAPYSRIAPVPLLEVSIQAC